MPHDFAGGTPELWNYRVDDERRANARPGASFRSAGDRAILRSALSNLRLNRGDTVLELGCGSASFLTRIALATGAIVAGVDFSWAAVEVTRRRLIAAGLDASRIELDSIENYVTRHRDEFDVVVSFGLVEHFADLNSIVAAHFACARGGGRVFITAPNLTKLNLAWARYADPSLFTWHRPISAAQVRVAMERAEATNLAVEHLGGPRLFAQAKARELHTARYLSATAARKLMNGAGEVAYRIAPGMTSRLAGATMSGFFAVTGTKP
jgi:2-polyprenyl-3-methyl-5-hydroxy-6-metoxy-1,4-benzoquinol methylase